MKKKVRILSIDGGGIRGIIPGVILTYIEKSLQIKEGRQDVRLSDYFELVAGTSTGGILTCLYLAPDENNRPKFSTEEAVDLYMKMGKDIFHRSFRQKLLSTGGVSDEKFSVNALEIALNEYFKDLELRDLLRPCLITAYDIKNRKTHIFDQISAIKSDIKNYYLRDVARATSAAPTYFEVANIKSLQGTPYSLIDGGMVANNPALCAYSEARTIYFSQIREDLPDLPFADDMMLVSIGTGSQGVSYSYDDAKNWGLIGWISPIIDILMSGSSEIVNYQLGKIFNQKEKGGIYIRLEPTTYNASPEMDDGSPKNLNALHDAGNKFISDNFEFLDNIVDKLIANK